MQASEPVNPPQAGQRLGRNDRVLWRRVSAGVLVLGPVSEETLLLSGSAAVVWELLCSPMSEADIVGFLSGAYDTSPEVVGPDIHKLVGDLIDVQVLVRQP